MNDMSWYKFAKDYVATMLDEKETMQHVNAVNPMSLEDIEEPVTDPDALSLEEFLDPLRDNSKDPVSKKQILEYMKGNQYFSHGQGGNVRMQEGRDLSMYSDNFTNMNDMNS